MKPHEFWHPRIFEAPYYFYLGLQCLLNGVGVRTLAKANYNLHHGEIGLGSKYSSQLAFNQHYFLPTTLIKSEWSVAEKKQYIGEFVAEHGYPVILKSDVGCVGKGICKLTSADDVEKKAPLLLGDYILQKFTALPDEYGVFFIRKNGVPRITGINKKHFPNVEGNGKDSILQLAKKHERYSHHWHSFLQNIDVDRIPVKGEVVRLSFIGSHTLGCKFTDDTHLITPELEKSVFTFFSDQLGYNFGRFDVKTESEEAFKRGEFVVIEVNGVASLPTHMFDPKFSVMQAYKIFFQHAKYLAEIAREYKQQPMELFSYRKIIQRTRDNQYLLNKVHDLLKG